MSTSGYLKDLGPTRAKFIAELPPGFDGRARLALTPDNRIVAAHPDHPPVVLDERTRTWVPQEIT